jgi:hypothetical protein
LSRILDAEDCKVIAIGIIVLGGALTAMAVSEAF